MGYRELVLATPGLIGYWRLGEHAGTVAADELGAHDGTYVGAVELGLPGIPGGRADGAMGTDGVGLDDFMATTWTDAPVPGTIEAWIRPDAWPVEAGIAGWYHASGVKAFRLFCTGDGATFINARVAFETGNRNANVITSLDGAWHQLVGTHDGTNARLYFDGAIVAGAGAIPYAGGAMANPFKVGIHDDSGVGATTFPGGIDEVSVYDVALDAATIAAHYAAGSTASGIAAIAAAIAARFAPDALPATPAGCDAIRSSSARLVNDLPARPCVLVFADAGKLRSAGGSRLGTQDYQVRMYYDELGAGDLERDSGEIQEWLTVFVDQLRDTVQLGGMVARASVEGWRLGILTYGGVQYTGLELQVRVVTSEAWSAVA